MTFRHAQTGELRIAAQICTSEWHLLPSVSYSQFRPGRGPRLWSVCAAFLCFSVWIESL